MHAVIIYREEEEYQGDWVFMPVGFQVKVWEDDYDAEFTGTEEECYAWVAENYPELM